MTNTVVWPAKLGCPPAALGVGGAGEISEL